jgi:hypothetical protein
MQLSGEIVHLVAKIASGDYTEEEVRRFRAFVANANTDAEAVAIADWYWYLLDQYPYDRAQCPSLN